MRRSTKNAKKNAGNSPKHFRNAGKCEPQSFWAQANGAMGFVNSPSQDAGEEEPTGDDETTLKGEAFSLPSVASDDEDAPWTTYDDDPTFDAEGVDGGDDE
jgi:hypothetical protein